MEDAMEHPAATFGLTILFAYQLAACSIQDPGNTRPETETQAGGKALTGCAQVGPLTCELPPLQDLSAEACAMLRSCLEGRQFGDQLIEQVIDCDTPVLSAASGQGMAAAVAAQLQVDGPPSYGAYLFIHLQQGWCPADILLEPAWDHGGYCESQHAFRWEAGATDSGAELHVVSERICHMPLDQEEIAAGESDIAMSECRRTQYGLAGNLVTIISQFDTEGPCQSR